MTATQESLAPARLSLLARLGRMSPATQYLLLVVVCLVLYMAWPIWTPITEDDEARYAGATREMIASHDYVFPTFNHLPRYKKPILYYLIQAPSVRLLGITEIAARLPSAILTLLLVSLLFVVLRRWLAMRTSGRSDEDDGVVFLATLGFATLLMTAFWARAATTDVALTFFVALSCVPLLHIDLLRREGTPKAERAAFWWYHVAAVMMGLAVLTKGPIGAAIPILTWLIYHGRQKSLISEARRVPWISAMVLFVIFALPWYAATVALRGWGFLESFIIKENFLRFTTTMEGHGGKTRLEALVYYLPFAVLFLYPMSPLLLGDLIAPMAHSAEARKDDVVTRLRRFGWVWMLAVIGIFSLSRTQLPSYIQSVIFPTGLLVAVALFSRFRTSDAKLGLGARIAEGVLFVLFGVVLPAVVMYIFSTGAFPVETHLARPFPATAMIWGVSGIAVTALAFTLTWLWWIFRRQTPAVFTGILISWTLFLTILLCGVFPVFMGSAYAATTDAGRYLRDHWREIPVMTYTVHFPEGLVYYSQRDDTIIEVKRPRPGLVTAEEGYAAITEQLAKSGSVIIVTDADGADALRTRFTVEPVGGDFAPAVVLHVSRLSPARPPAL